MRMLITYTEANDQSNCIIAAAPILDVANELCNRTCCNQRSTVQIYKRCRWVSSEYSKLILIFSPYPASGREWVCARSKSPICRFDVVTLVGRSQRIFQAASFSCPGLRKPSVAKGGSISCPRFEDVSFSSSHLDFLVARRSVGSSAQTPAVRIPRIQSACAIIMLRIHARPRIMGGR